MMATDKAADRDYWTPARVHRLERFLESQADDIYLQSFLQRLMRQPDLAQKQKIISRELPLLTRDHTFVRLWEGDELAGKLAARDALVSFLHAAGITLNLPTEAEESSEERAARERLAHLFGEGKSVSDIVIEQRERP